MGGPDARGREHGHEGVGGPSAGAGIAAGAVYGYVGGADPSGATVSPLFADLRGLAPLLIQCGSNEVLLDDATRLAAAAAAADVAVQLDITPEMPHVFQASAPDLVEADAALGRTGAFLRSRLRLGRCRPNPGRRRGELSPPTGTQAADST